MKRGTFLLNNGWLRYTDSTQNAPDQESVMQINVDKQECPPFCALFSKQKGSHP